jgi:hypothetical protein
MGVATQAGAALCQGSIDHTDAVPLRSVWQSVTQGLGNEVWDRLSNNVGQPHIAWRPPGTFPQYASAGRITKSAEEPFNAG